MPPRKAKVSPMNEDNANQIIRSFKANENIEVRPSSWVLPNRVKFSQWVADNFNYEKLPKSEKLFESQRFVKDYLQYDSPYRGVLLFHSLGTGKSQASIVAAENLINDMEVVILLPASLKPNYIEEIKKASGFFTTQQNWVFKELARFKDDEAVMETLCRRLFVTPKIIKANKGVWIPQKTGEPNWNARSVAERTQINNQIDVMIETKYKFINYNGISIKKLAELKEDGNALDGKVVIVDEVHNLISGTVGSGQRGKKLYDLILTAKDAKLILLSGTPIINHPYEIAVLVNLLKGPVDYYELTKWKGFDPAKIAACLDKHPYVDSYEIFKDKGRVVVQLLPPSFVFKNKKQSLVARETEMVRKDAEEIVAEIQADLAAKQMGCGSFEKRRTYVFPIKAVGEHQAPLTRTEELKEAFNHYFIDFTTEDVKNQKMLARRMAGCVSYFGANSKEYPERLPDKNVVLEMSDWQFNIYRENRAIERTKEERAKKQGAKKRQGDDNVLGSSGQIYRAYSRANCNFVFPEGIKRPYPSKVAMLYKDELEGEDDEEVGVAANKDETFKKAEALTYKEEIERALELLVAGPDHLKLRNLPMFSPKYHALINILNGSSQGKSLVYSQFRTVEGLGVLALALNANGWAEFKVRKVGASWELDMDDADIGKPAYFQYRGDEEETKMLLNIFNNDLNLVPANIVERLKPATDNKHGDMLKLIMITQSGAEGISLKHVRQVHILEPYWNEIRIEQVIGRAIRAKSHMELPERERNVQVYRYIVKMTEKQVKEDVTLENKDVITITGVNGRKEKVPATTDQYILDIAYRKAFIINKVQDIMKKASVNCLVHSKHHPKLKCMGFPQNADPNALTYHLDYDEDETDFEYAQKVKTQVVKACKKCTIGDVSYAYDPTNKKLYDLEAYKEGRLKQVGYLEMVDRVKGTHRLVLLE